MRCFGERRNFRKRLLGSGRFMAQLRIIHYKIRRKKSLLEGGRPFRMAMLADLHNSPIAQEGGLLRRQLARLAPDVVLCCGDMLTAKFGKAHTGMALSLLQELTKEAPVYYVNGNHETRLSQFPLQYPEREREYFRELARMGVHLLNNASTPVTIAGNRFVIAGFEVPLSFYKRVGSPKPEDTLLEEALGEASEEDYTVLLSHHPDFFEACSAWGADLVLSGHLHGGMVRLPLAGGVVGASLKPFPKYDRGKFELSGAGTMIVSGGLGDHTIPLRLHNPPELVMLECI